MKYKIEIIFCSILVLLFNECTPTPNDDDISISGRYVVVDQEGNIVPFEHKVHCGMTVSMNSQVSYGYSTYKQSIPLYSEEDGTFDFEVKNVGSYMAQLNSIYREGDTIMYFNDTTIICSYGNPQKDVLIPLTLSHTFNPIMFPQRCVVGDSITLSINHDVLTKIEICISHLDINGNVITNKEEMPEYNILWRFNVENKPTITFLLDDYENILPDHERFIHLLMRYTTLNYGTHSFSWYLYDK